MSEREEKLSEELAESEQVTVNSEASAVSVDESLLAGTSFGKSREEVKALLAAEAEAAKREKEEARRLAAAAAKQARADMFQNKASLIFLIVLVGVVVLAIVAGLLWDALVPTEQEILEKEGKLQNEDLSYFEDTEATADFSEEGIKGAIQKAYYTTGGHLAIRFDLSNGMDTAQHPTSIYVEVSNEDDEVLGKGRADSIDKDYAIAAGAHSSFMLYIAPDHVKINNDDLDQLSYTITIESNEVN